MLIFRLQNVLSSVKLAQSRGLSDSQHHRDLLPPLNRTHFSTIAWIGTFGSLDWSRVKLLRMDTDSSVVPLQLQMGVPMLKISSKKIKQVIFKIRSGCILWSSKKDSRGR